MLNSCWVINDNVRTACTVAIDAMLPRRSIHIGGRRTCHALGSKRIAAHI